MKSTFIMRPGNILSLLLPLILLLSWAPNATTPDLQVPVTYYKLPNGLKVVLSPDKTAPIITVGVYYNIGFRIEPKNRTGFAHLFEHMMFQGSENLGKMEFIKLVQTNGGILNGSTRFDFTNYYEVMPSHKLETALWAEADRMKGLKITQENLTNQQGVVKNEVKVNVLNQPYGGFPWLDMPQYANKNWYNAHNFYGDLADLDSARLEDVDQFFKTYYAPNNAVLAVVGDFDISPAKKWIGQYFSKIPSSKLPAQPDLSEPPQEKEQRFTREDKLAKKPAVAVSYKMPERNSPDYYALGLIDQMLVKGQDSKLYQKLVQEKGYTAGVSGGINIGLGNMFNYNGPMLWTTNLIYDSTVSVESILQELDKAVAEITNNTTPEDLQLATVKMRSFLYDAIASNFGIGKVDMLACFALFDDNPNRINQLETEFKKITPQDIRRAAEKYLTAKNRTILVIQPKS